MVGLPIHCPELGRMRTAPIPAPIEAKTSDAPHLIVIPETFFPRTLACSDLLT